MSGVLYLLYFFVFTGFALALSLIAERFPRRASRGFWAVAAMLAGSLDLLTSVAWARLLGMTFGRFEANVVAVALGPAGTILVGLGALLIGYGGFRLSDRRTGPHREAGAERIAWTTLALRSTLLCVWNAVICLSVIMSA